MPGLSGTGRPWAQDVVDKNPAPAGHDGTCPSWLYGGLRQLYQDRHDAITVHNALCSRPLFATAGYLNIISLRRQMYPAQLLVHKVREFWTDLDLRWRYELFNST